jgi:class 3 adenylate cyclase/CheY-like chemotaxis protein
MPRSKILIVDDEPYNVDYLEQELDDLGYATVAAVNGQEALTQVEAEAPDLILLDIMMPILDGFAVLERLKANAATRDIPVIIISANTDMASIVRGIKLGAEDYLPKPFEPVLLQARLTTGLANKLRRDQELEYLRQVEQLTTAAQAVQGNSYDSASLAPVAARADALGNLARVFQRMAQEVVAREQRLKQQLRQLQLDIEEQHNSAADTAAVYIPMDRRQALAHGATLPEHTTGAALFADISGFTALTETFARELGLQRGAEEITRQINQIHTVLIENVHRYRGSVVGFSGDAITCWFDSSLPSASESPAAGNANLRALACALSMQADLKRFANLATPNGTTLSIGVKVALAAGTARRWLVGDPAKQVIDVLVGSTIDDLSEAEHLAQRGEVVAPQSFTAGLGGSAIVSEWRAGNRFAILSGLTTPVAAAPWPELPVDAITNEQAQVWLPPAVFEKVQNGQSAFLSELRPAAPLFLKFGGLDYDNDPQAQTKLDAFIRWVQSVIDEHDGAILQVTMGDKGSYIYIVFGAPLAHYDDAVRATLTALKLQQPPAQFNFLTDIRVGVTYGQMRAGAYGSPAQRSYGAIGDKTNLAARLMMAAAPNATLGDEAIYEAARDQIQFQTLPPITVKGKSQPLNVYQPLAPAPGQTTRSADDMGRAAQRALLIDHLSPADQLALKTASVIGRVFSFELLQAVYPEANDKAGLAEQLQTLSDMNLIVPNAGGPGPSYTFIDSITQETAYSLMLFAQRRQLHRAIAEWHELSHPADLTPPYALLAHHWRAADEPAKAIEYYEKAGEQARLNSDYETALNYFNEALSLEAHAPALNPPV